MYSCTININTIDAVIRVLYQILLVHFGAAK